MSAEDERDAADELGRELFRAARREAPSPEARRRTRKLLSVSVASGSLLSAGKAGAATGSGAGLVGKSSVAKFMASTAGMLIKIAGIGVVGAVAWMALPRAQETDRPLELTAERTQTRQLEKPVASVEEGRGQRPVPIERGHVAAPEPTPARSASPARERHSSGPGPQRVRQIRAPEPGSAESLSSELGMLDRARRELLQGKNAQALHVLDEYGARFARGQLASEATALRIEALGRAGQQSAASELGRRFIEQHPNDPLVDRIRSLLDSARAAPKDAQ